MKPITKISMLTGFVITIVGFWLIPGINTSEADRYTRIYEDTDKKINGLKSDDYEMLSTNYNRDSIGKRLNKIYKKESIRPDEGLRTLKAEMFSRAIHYTEEVIMSDDSLNEIQLTTIDSTNNFQLSLDSLDLIQMAAIDSVDKTR